MAFRFFIVAVAIATLLQYSTAQTSHVVGDSLGWIVPPNGAATYSNWAAKKTFTVGDILVFNFAPGRHDVTVVTQSSFNACNTTSPLSRTTNSPANITLTSGAHYYICSFPGHCLGGQKLTINVSATASSPAPQPSSTPSPTPTPTRAPSAPTPAPTRAPSAPTPAPTRAPSAPTPAPTPAPTRQPVTHVVGDALGWTVPPNSSVDYQNWARTENFMVGDILVFNYATGTHDVAEVTKAAYDSCNSSTTLSKSTNPPTRITLTKPGEHYYLCTFPNHCSLRQKLAINVTGSSSTAPTVSPTSPTAATPPSSTTTPTAQSPEGVTAPPPPNSSAMSFGAASVFTTFVAIVVALLY